MCFLHFFDKGLRSGDIVDAAFTEMHWNHPSMIAWIGRIGYAFSFFFVVGVILFNIVAGIIIDAFGGLRELQAERQSQMRNFSFISGIERQDYEENGWDFILLDNEEQDKWNYVYFLLHLAKKPEDEYTGAESSINNRILNNDVSWLPDRNSWKLQLKHGAGISLAEEDVPENINKIRHALVAESEKRLKMEKHLNEQLYQIHSDLSDMKRMRTAVLSRSMSAKVI